MDVCPVALLESLKSDLTRNISADDLLHLEAEVSFTRWTEPRLVARRLLLNSFLKKYGEDVKEKKAADRAAFALFEHSNQVCKEWSEPKPENEVEALALGEFRQAFLQCFELPGGELINFSDQVSQYLRPGPGAAVDAKLTDLYTKLYAGSLSTTSEDLYWHYYAGLLPFDLELQAEVERSACFGTPVVRGSNLGFALKNRDITRVTCSEPNLNMLYQLGTGQIIEEVLLEVFNIDLSTQPDMNRELSRLGSIWGTFGTTDLTSASDSTACKFWKWAMPYKEVHNWFMWLRSPRTRHPFKQGEWVEQHMLSSMGNGFTFPLMTLIFACVVKAAYRTLGIPMVYNKTSTHKLGLDHTCVPEVHKTTKPGNFGVFGDDIIVVTPAFELVNRLLELLGYKVNSSKSFGKGPFRESCGTDWHLGQNVRGVYCKRLKRPQHRYSLINRLNAWSAEWDIPLPDTIAMLLKTVWYLPVPPWESADAGIHVPFSMLTKLKHDKYGGFVYSALRVKKLTWAPSRGLTDDHEKPLGVYNMPKDFHGPRAPFVNEWGVILATVRGYLKRGLVNCRDDNAKFSKTRLTTPGWAFKNESTCGFSTLGWARFEKTLASVNLGRNA